MLHYILQIVAFQVVSLLVYDLFLKRETFFNYNRIYLMGTAVLSFVLPFIKLESIKSVIPEDFKVVLPELIIGKMTPITKLDNQIAIQSSAVLEEPSLSLWQIIFFIGAITSTVLFLFKIFKLYRLKSNNPKRWRGDVLIVKLLKSSAAFSFFNTVFLGEKISEDEKPTILKHELVHVKQWHSVDVLVFEIMRILLWFNPLVYMYQSRIKALHEYIADAISVKQNGKKSYYQELLNQVFETQSLSFTNTFFKSSLIKNRIAMLQKSKSHHIKLLKYAFLIPVISGMLFYTSCVEEVVDKQDLQEINLEELSYSLEIDSKMSEETKVIHDSYEEFLKSNKDYVSWAIIDNEKKIVNYTVHHKNEAVPEGYTEATISAPDGRSYNSYMNFNYFDSIKEEKIYDETPELPYAVIENAPTLEDCKDLSSNAERKKCTSDKIAKFVNKNFNTDLATQLGLQGRQRISVGFKINQTGDVIDIYVRAPHPGLEKETKRVISMLPKFIPGTHKGKLVTVPYGLPIIFQVQETSTTGNAKNNSFEERKTLNYDDVVGNGISFSVIDKIPTLEECKNINSKEGQKECVSGKILDVVSKNFNTALAKELGLKGRQRISVGFKIGVDGNVHSAFTRAPHPKLEAEGLRVIDILPKFIPGEHKGKKVDVLYMLPIVFEVQ